jgi:hypothetical protein
MRRITRAAEGDSTQITLAVELIIRGNINGYLAWKVTLYFLYPTQRRKCGDECTAQRRTEHYAGKHITEKMHA